MKIFKTEKGKRAVFESYDRLLAAWGVEFEERFIDGSFGRTHVILAGNESKPPLLLFHGVGDNSSLMWIYNAKGLCERFRIIAVDTMGGAGKSEPGHRYDKGFSLRKWQGEILDSLKLEKTYAAGVSYGSYLAQLIASAFPERIMGIVAMSGTLFCAGALKASNKRMLTVFLPALLVPFGKNGGKARLIKALTGPKRDKVFENRELFNHWNMLMSKYAGPMAQRRHDRKELSEEEIASFREKALFLIGEKDELFYEQAVTNFAKYDINYRIIEGVGHTLNHEEPEIANRAIINFLLEGKLEK